MIRALTPHDAPEIAKLWHAGALESMGIEPKFVPRRTASEYATHSVGKELAAGEAIGWGAFEGERMAGYLTASVLPPLDDFERGCCLMLYDLDVGIEFRRRGIGSLLVAAAREYALAQKLEGIEVCWLAGDPRADAFWRSHGFVPYLARAKGPISPTRP